MIGFFARKPFCECFFPLLLLGMAGGCSAPAANRRSNAGGLTVSLAVGARAAGTMSFRSVSPGDSLHSGDQLLLSVVLDQPAYLYAIVEQPAAPALVLYPEKTERRESPGREIQATPAGKPLRLDDRAGEEVLYVIASERKIAEAAPSLMARLRIPPNHWRGDDEKGKGEPPPPPPDTGDQNRGGSRGDSMWSCSNQPGCQPLRAQSDASGVAVLRFQFQHLGQ